MVYTSPTKLVWTNCNLDSTTLVLRQKTGVNNQNLDVALWWVEAEMSKIQSKGVEDIFVEVDMRPLPLSLDAA